LFSCFLLLFQDRSSSGAKKFFKEFFEESVLQKTFLKEKLVRGLEECDILKSIKDKLLKGIQPDFLLESAYRAEHPKGCVAGVDEVGYGAWAGPVLVCAVVLYPENVPSDVLGCVRDSKMLSAADRAWLFSYFKDHPSCLDASFSLASPEEVDQHNVLCATHRAMLRAIETLSCRVTHVLVDGCHRLPLPASISQDVVVQGDRKSLSIAVASILAKVTRDTLMASLAKDYPAFGWEKNKGYGTRLHQEALALYGPTAHHRRSYKIFSSCAQTF
jgi:ribonuclease HII